MSKPCITATDEAFRLLANVKLLAREYRALTGRPLGVTGEVAEYEAVRLLPDLELAPVRQAGYDAIRRTSEGFQRLQIKGRCTPMARGRLGAISLTQDWDAVLLVLLDSAFEATAIYEADRDTVALALTKPGSKARNERGQLAISSFVALGKRIWPTTE